MLSQADKNGVVYASIPGLARIANLSIEEVEEGLRCFQSPDIYSRTPDNEGRRIEAVDGGWRLLNHAKYDAMRSAAERAEYKRKWDRENRPSGYQRKKESPTQSDTVRQEHQKSDSPTPFLTSHFSEEKLFSGSPDGEPPETVKPAKADPIPYQAIVDGYNATLTDLSKVRLLTADRRTAIRKAWQAVPDKSLRFFDAIWRTYADDPFTNGRGPYSGEHANWRPDFDYLIRAKVITKAFERAMTQLETMQ